MKSVLGRHQCLLLLLCSPVAFAAQFTRRDVAKASSAQKADEPRTLTKVVTMLQDMMAQSQADGAAERETYAKFKCYCDHNEEEKTESIRKLTAQIETLSTEISGLQADNGKLSEEVADNKAEREATDAKMTEARNIRDAANLAYKKAVDDMTFAIRRMTDAIDTLAAVGADQTLQSARDHEKYMAGYGQEKASPSPAPASLLKLKARIQEALAAASSFVPEEKLTKFQSFIQAPFTGSYTAQSGEVVGILKNMRDTFESELAAAHAKEKQELAAYNDFMELSNKKMKTLLEAYNRKQGELSANSDSLETKKGQKLAAEQNKASDEAFLDQLRPVCSQKAKEYQERLSMRKNEEAAIAEAIAILNSDAAFTTFGKVDATKTGGMAPDVFLQMRSHRRHAVSGKTLQIEQLLHRASKKTNSDRLKKAEQMLKDGNPFDVVLAEIQKMIDLIAEEGEADSQKLSWCKTERKRTKKDIETKKQEITQLKSAIDTLKRTIHAPDDGLLALIEADETSLATNLESQKDETSLRKKENAEYQEDVAHLVEAQRLLKKAKEVLERYYAKVLKELEAASLVQESPDPPATWEGPYAGQSSQGKTVIDVLSYILSETAAEEKAAHQDEENAQKTYEDSMQTLTDQEAQLEKNLVKLRKQLAETEKLLAERKQDLKATNKAKAALWKYLMDIKPGCDFITANFAKRETYREEEKTALEQARNFIKGTPVYQGAVEDARVEALGACQPVCLPLGKEEYVECKACLAGVSIPGYCAGHPDTKGCESIESS